MKNISFLLFASLTTFSSYGQIEKQINKILLKSDYNAFINFANEYDLEKNNIQINKGNVREITKGFQEGMFEIVKSYPYDKGVTITCNLRLNIITKGNQIIYFYLESKALDDSSKDFNILSDTTYKFTDSKKMEELRRQFELSFKAPLNFQELFIDTIALGSKCGHYPGKMLKQQDQVITWSTRRDIVSLLKWLQSSNTETQLYAVRGFHYLLLRGIEIKEETRIILRNVITKKGTVFTCIPCDLRITSISEVVKGFKF